MKKILITGANSYIGTRFSEYMSQWPERYQVDTVDMIGDGWRGADFSQYDSVYHVAGLAHSDMGYVSEDQKEVYYRVNRDLTIQTAQKAKAEGVKQFIFMSSSIVYGESAPVGKQKIIDVNTPAIPANCYGDSKLQAERGLLPMNDEKFKVVILRPPMVYGPGCKGNYPVLGKLARMLPVFLDVDNCRSMLYVDNLMEFVRLMVENEEQGIFWPQNGEYSNTGKLVAMIAKTRGKRILLVRGFTWVLKLFSYMTPLINKAFGSLAYDMKLSEYKENYRLYSLEQSITETEGKHESGN